MKNHHTQPAKVSAYEVQRLLINIDKNVTVLDKKIGELEKKKINFEKSKIPFAVRLSILLMAIGAVLVCTVFLPVIKEFVGLTLTDKIWNCIYLAYAGISLPFAVLCTVKKPIRFTTAAMAIAPLVASIIVSL